MQMLCERRVDCAPGLLTNYSAEGAEPFPPFFSVVFPPPNPPPFDTDFSAQGCLYICRSFISQEDADLCALRQSILCTNPPDNPLFFSAPADCCVTCPDGTVFCFHVDAGMFIAPTLAEALAQAQAYACLKAEELRVCLNNPECPNCGSNGSNASLGQLPRCACVGVPYSGTIEANGAIGQQTWSVVGALPPGLTFTPGVTNAVISGTPLLRGTYAFQVVAAGSNHTATRVFTIQALEITTTSLSAFTIGTPYSFQLEADGGSGNYSWSIVSGVLPDGLTLSAGGLISGTPTAAGTNPILFSVVDLTCEAAQRSNFPPRATLVTASSTRIETRHGFYEYTGGGTGFLYKRVDWSGSITQIAFPYGNAEDSGLDEIQCGGVEFRYDGFDQIDIYGRITNRHTRIPFTMCDTYRPTIYRFVQFTPPAQPVFLPNDNPRILWGYCWDTDPGSCPVCDDDQETWTPGLNRAFFGPVDFPFEIILDPTEHSSTPTPQSFQYTGLEFKTGGITLDPNSVPTFPRNTAFGFFTQGYPFIRIEANGTFGAVLSEPFTDADANASAVTFNGTLSVARNSPNFKSWVTEQINHLQSQTTSVLYEIRTTNLIVGRNYIASVQLISSTGASIIRQYPFTADATGHDIFDSVPTPAANTTITVRNARIFFAP